MQNQTVYRDKSGKKLDPLNEFMKQQALKEGKVKLDIFINILKYHDNVQDKKLAEAQYAWGGGTIQKENESEKQKEFEIVTNEPFARKIDDPRVDQMRKEAIREGDPMAEYITSKRKASAPA